MEPKFQSTFIPKTPVMAAQAATRLSRGANRSVLGTLAVLVFALTLLLLAGVFGYEFYLKSNISRMGENLALARQSLEPETIEKIADLDKRIVGAADLLENHIVLSPLFDYLENSTLRTVRFTQFDYRTTEKGLELFMRGEARGYSAVALQSEIFNKSPYFKNPIFADLDLDEKGNVTFTFKALIDSSIVSYKKEVSANAPTAVPVALPPPESLTPAATSSAPASASTSSATSTP